MKGDRPDFVVHCVTGFGRGKSRWKEVGVAWWNKDRASFTVMLDAVPLSGRLVVMRPRPRSEEEVLAEALPALAMAGDWFSTCQFEASRLRPCHRGLTVY